MVQYWNPNLEFDYQDANFKKCGENVMKVCRQPSSWLAVVTWGKSLNHNFLISKARVYLYHTTPEFYYLLLVYNESCIFDPSGNSNKLMNIRSFGLFINYPNPWLHVHESRALRFTFGNPIHLLGGGFNYLHCTIDVCEKWINLGVMTWGWRSGQYHLLPGWADISRIK